MAWISVDKGIQTALDKKGTGGHGSNKYDFIHWVSPEGDEWLFTWKQVYASLNTGSKSIVVYRNGVVIRTLQFLTGNYGVVNHYTHSGNPCCLITSTGELFYVKASRTGDDYEVDVYKYTLATDTVSATTETLALLSSSRDISGSFVVGIAHDPLNSTMYVFAAGSRVSVGGATEKLRLWELDSDGVLDHRLVNSDIGSQNYATKGPRMCAIDGWVYLYYQTYRTSTGLSKQFYCKIDATTTNGSLTETSVTSGGVISEDRYGVIGPWGLYVLYNETTLRSQNSAATWDLSGSLSTDNQLVVFMKEAATEDFIVLTRNFNYVYVFRCANDGTTTGLGVSNLTSAMGHHPANIKLADEAHIVDVYPKSCQFGTAKIFVDLHLPTREVT